MTGEEHILEWIKSSKPHYIQLMQISRQRLGFSANFTARKSFSLALDAYHEMITDGDAYKEDHSAETILKAAILILKWEFDRWPIL